MLIKNIPRTILKFQVEKTTEDITSRFGLAIYSEAFRAIGGYAESKRALPKPLSNRGYQPSSFLEPLILMLIGGGRALEDIREIKNDRALRRVAKLEKIPSPNAIASWLTKIGTNHMDKLESVNETIRDEVLMEDDREDYTLDVDATSIESDKREAKMTYKGFTGYMPMLGFLAEWDLCLCDEFREGNESPGSKAVEFLDKCLEAMPESKRIARLRSDSAWYQSAIFNRCEELGIIFTITADQDDSVKRAIKCIDEKSWAKLKDEDGFDTGREYSETVHCMNGTDKSFRLIVQRWRNSKQQDIFNPEKFGYYVIATNSEDAADKVILFHNKRGNSENYNKELKCGIGMERMPRGDFNANACFFRIGTIAYNLFIATKRLFMGGEWIKKQISTIRWRFIQIAGKVVKHGRKLILKLSQITDEMFEFILAIRRRCYIFYNKSP